MADASNSPDPTTADDPTPTDNPPEETTADPTPTDNPPEETTSDNNNNPPDETTSDRPPNQTTSERPPEPTNDDNNDDDNNDDNNNDDSTSTVVTVITRTPTTTFPDGSTPTVTDGPAQTSEGDDDDGGGGGLPNSGKIAIAVVVPVVAVALLLIAGIWFWKRRKARKDAEEERRKEVEDYAYNPNADPTLPPVGGLTSESPYEMRDDHSGGYRGWGSTAAAGAVGAKALSGRSGGGHTGGYSESTGPRNPSDTRSGEMMDPREGAYSPESGEILGAMGPSVAGNRGDIRRGPSNASSSYSAGGRSDGSDGAGAAYANQYYDQYTGGNPYAGDAYNQRPTELPGQPIIRDNPARRNTRIENPSHYPQQSAGISQNF